MFASTRWDAMDDGMTLSAGGEGTRETTEASRQLGGQEEGVEVTVI